jgi:hypothetical protein
MTGEGFLAYVEQVLIPTLQADDIVVLDNLPAHKIAAVRAAIDDAGAQLFLLPSYLPDMNPIEWPSSSSRPCCAKPPNEPATGSGDASVTCSTSSPLTNAPTISQPPDMAAHSENALVRSLGMAC